MTYKIDERSSSTLNTAAIRNLSSPSQSHEIIIWKLAKILKEYLANISNSWS